MDSKLEQNANKRDGSIVVPVPNSISRNDSQGENTLSPKLFNESGNFKLVKLLQYPKAEEPIEVKVSGNSID